MSTDQEGDNRDRSLDVSMIPAGPDKKKAQLWSLVLDAFGIPHRLRSKENGWRLDVPEALIDRARREITLFERENENWPPPGPAVEEARHETGFYPPTILFMGGLAVFHGVTGSWSAESPWFVAGAVDRIKIITEGEWWRLLTALTLHADPVHVAANAVIGGILVHYLCRMTGSGLGWFLILLAGVIGNAFNILLRSGAHLSVGFSTAVFGTVGILAGLQSVRKGTLRGILPPIGAGIALLALLGTEGERTDLGAHLWGLTAGAAVGVLMGFMPAAQGLTRKNGFQLLMLSFCLLMVWLCWRVALA